jgi:hypothetical protein
MTMTKRIGFALVLLLGLGLHGRAHAQTSGVSSVSAIICNPVAGSGGIINYGQYGVNNTSTTATATIECSVPLGQVPGSGTFSLVQITMYDRNPSSDVVCVATGVSAVSGGVNWTATVQTAGATSGPQTRNITPPSSASTIDALRIRCTIPPFVSGSIGDNSHVVAFKVTTN